MKLPTIVGRPMPRLTNWPGFSSRAVRSAISSRDQARLLFDYGHVATRSALALGDRQLVVHRLVVEDDAVDVDAGDVDVLRADRARRYDFVHLGDGDPR